jgi:hypothetical protein
MILKREFPSAYKVKQDDFIKTLEQNGAEILLSSDHDGGQAMSEAMNRQGYELMLCTEPFNGEYMELSEWLKVVDAQVSTIPNYITLSGKSRLWYLESKEEQLGDNRDYLLDLSNLLEAALMKIYQFNMKSTGVYAKSVEIAEKMIATV